MWCNCDQFYVEIIVILYRHALLHCTRSPIDRNVASRGVKNCASSRHVYLAYVYACMCVRSMCECVHDVFVCRMVCVRYEFIILHPSV